MSNFTPFDDDDAREIDDALRYQAEMERRPAPRRLSDIAPKPTAPADPIAAMLAQQVENAMALQRMHQQLSAAIADQSERINRVEMVAAQSRDWMELLGFVVRYSVSPVDTDERSMAMLGKKVRDWHLKLHLDFKQRKAFHSRYGGVNLWQVRHLYRYFVDSGYTLDEELYREDVAQSGRGR